MIAQLLLTTGAVLALSGCATYVSTPAPQAFRLQGEDQAINITGKAIQKEGFLKHQSDVEIYFDNALMIQGRLDQSFHGEFKGSEYKGKPTSASCTSRYITRDAVEVRCMVFIGNERTVTLSF